MSATASPTWLTSSTAIDGWPGLTMSGVTGQAHGMRALLLGEVPAGEDGDDARRLLGRR